MYDNDNVIDDPARLAAMANTDETFSHQGLVMTAYRKVIEASAKEMRKGWIESKKDKFGNQVTVWHEDTRQVLINTIETMRIIMMSDTDETANTNINKIYQDLESYRNDYAMQEHNAWLSLPINRRLLIPHIEGQLNQDLPYYHKYLDLCVDGYRQIFQELELLLKRTKYFRKELNRA